MSSFLKKDGGTKKQKSMVPDLATQPKAVKLVVSKIGSICSEYDDPLGSEWKTLWASLLELLVGEEHLVDLLVYLFYLLLLELLLEELHCLTF